MPLTSLKQIYNAYTLLGANVANAKNMGMDPQAWLRICKDAELTKFLNQADLDNLFIMARTASMKDRYKTTSTLPGKNAKKQRSLSIRKINFGEFEFVIGLLAAKIEKSTDDVTKYLLRKLQKGPKIDSLTQAQATKLHDDTSKYTGTIRQGGHGNEDNKSILMNALNRDDQYGRKKATEVRMRRRQSLAILKSISNNDDNSSSNNHSDNIDSFFRSTKGEEASSIKTRTGLNDIDRVQTSNSLLVAPPPAAAYHGYHIDIGNQGTQPRTNDVMQTQYREHISHIANPNKSTSKQYKPLTLNEFISSGYGRVEAIGAEVVKTTEHDSLSIRDEAHDFSEGCKLLHAKWVRFVSMYNESMATIKAEQKHANHIYEEVNEEFEELGKTLNIELERGALLERAVAELEVIVKDMHPETV
jgi:hypothetical protein